MESFLINCHFTGTPALTTRGMKEADIDKVVDFIDKALGIAKEVVKISGPKVADFNKTVNENPEIQAKINAVKTAVEEYSRTFPMPGISNY